MSDAKDRDTAKTAPTTPAEFEGMDHTFDAPADPSLSGRKIGAYSLRRLIGSGGMGAVYEAIQESPRRTVAVKLMRKGITSKSALRRFEFESQILARLRHPAIAQVYEAGTHDEDGEATPYFVMEYIPGALPLTTYAQRHDLSIRDRMKLFLQVCEAVQHGHLKGIVHRDLKPGNILISSHGKPKIIDFGVARSTDSDMALTTLQTDIGQILGTLQYMSPEQCAADPNDIDTRSDVYALGVVLHELLTGDVPYDVRTAALHEAVRIVQEERPTRLSSIDRRLKGDLETITGKALEKERRRRYQSASALAEDIGHWLDDEPIHARAPGAMDLLTRFARKHTTAAIAITAVFTILLGAAAGMSWLAFRAETARNVAEVAEQVGQLQLERAEIAKERAEAAKSFLMSMIGSIDSSTAGSMDKALMVHTLQQAADRLGTQFNGQPVLEAELRMAIGASFHQLGLFTEAIEHLQNAQLLLETQTSDQQELLILIIGRQARVLREAGRLDDAITMARQHLSMEEATNGLGHFKTAFARQKLGLMLIDATEWDESREQLNLAMDYYKLHPVSSAHVECRFAIAQLEMACGNLDEAFNNAKKADELNAQLENPSPETISDHQYLMGIVLAMQGKFEESRSFLEVALDNRLKYSGDSHPDTLETRGTLGAVLAQLGDIEAAEVHVRAVYEGQLDSLGAEHPNTLMTMANLGLMLLAQDKVDASEVLLEGALRITLRTKGTDNPATQNRRRFLADLRIAQGRLTEAEELLVNALAGLEETYGSDHLYAREASASLDLVRERLRNPVNNPTPN
ncbi:MAG: serine/threonine-protein kinase [Phycisphaerales bacterium]|nr:serine/threonine-protein kinase [Phycisphaerales bacterium]